MSAVVAALVLGLSAVAGCDRPAGPATPDPAAPAPPAATTRPATRPPAAAAEEAATDLDSVDQVINEISNDLSSVEAPPPDAD